MFNQLLTEAGEFGLYQKCLTFGFLTVNMILVSYVMWMQIFILMVPPHRCKTGVNDTSWNYNSSDAISEACFTRSNYSFSESTNNDSKVSDFAGLETDNNCPYGWIYDLTSKHETFASEQNMVCGDAWKMYAIHVAFFSGACAGAMLSGWMMDKYGRKRAYQVSLILNLLADIGTFFASDVTSFAVARFCASLGGTNLVTIGFLLAMEYTGPKYRLVNLAVWCLTATTGGTSIPWIAHLFHHWQHIVAVAFVLYFITFIASCLAPESASWLVTKGRIDDAAKLIHKVAKVNGKVITLEYIKNELEKEKKEEAEREKDLKVNKHTLLDLFRTPNLRKNTLLLSFLWMIASACYVGNNLEASNLPFPWYLSFSIGGISELPANLLCLFLLDRFGRRLTNVFFFVLGGSLSIAVGKFIQDPNAVIAVSMIVRLCYSAAFDITFTLSSETFPTAVRGRAVLLIRAFGSIANAMSPFVVYLSETEKLLPLAVLGLLSVFAGILNLFLPETAGQHLPQTIEEGERFGKDQPFCFCPFAYKENDDSPKSVTGKVNEGFEESSA